MSRLRELNVVVQCEHEDDQRFSNNCRVPVLLGLIKLEIAGKRRVQLCNYILDERANYVFWARTLWLLLLLALVLLVGQARVSGALLVLVTIVGVRVGISLAITRTATVD